MKIRMTATSADPTRVLRIGRIYDLEDAEGQALVEAGHAVRLDTPPGKPAAPAQDSSEKPPTASGASGKADPKPKGQPQQQGAAKGGKGDRSGEDAGKK